MDMSAFQQLDDSTVSVLAMLLGIIGGWYFTGLHQQMKAKRVKMSSKKQQTLRKPD
jgi:preprotein translocase subunit YajC